MGSDDKKPGIQKHVPTDSSSLNLWLSYRINRAKVYYFSSLSLLVDHFYLYTSTISPLLQYKLEERTRSIICTFPT